MKKYILYVNKAIIVKTDSERLTIKSVYKKLMIWKGMLKNGRYFNFNCR